MEKALYAIDCFTTERGQGMGGYGPSIVLAGEAVKQIVTSDTRRREDVPLYLGLKARMHNSLAKYDQSSARMDFHQDSWLLLGLHVGGNCACFGVDGDTRSAIERGQYSAIRYSPHNIDSVEHSAVILSTWLLWFNHIITLTESKLPFTI